MEDRGVFVGISGWEHEVMERSFYTGAEKTPEDRLRAYAQSFPLVEVRPTFWDDTLGADDAREWIAAVSEQRRFLFTVKLHSSFTHEKQIRPQLAKRVRALLAELVRSHRLGALLMQFPFAFTNVGAHRAHLERLAEAFRGFPCYIELRNDSWNFGGLDDFLREIGLHQVRADLPRLRQYMPFFTHADGDTAYLRLHGRNEKGWLQNGMDTRYDYLYNARELREIARRIEAIIPRCKRIIVVCNNTTNANAIANAFELASTLRGGKPVHIPESTLASFPHLRGIALRGEEEPLFGGMRQAM